MSTAKPPFKRPRGMSEDELCKVLREAEWVPAGMTEDECVSILYEIARKVAPRYAFGYNDDNDMTAQAVYKMIIELKQGKFKPRGEKPLAQQFRNFVRVWIRNRMSNYRRDKSCRYTNPDSSINKSKYNIMHPLMIHTYGLAGSEIFARELPLEDMLDNSHMVENILSNLSVNDRKLFLRKINGVTLSVDEENYLLEKCRDILIEDELCVNEI